MRKFFSLKSTFSKTIPIWFLVLGLLGLGSMSAIFWIGPSFAESAGPSWIFGGSTPSSFAELAQGVQGAVVNISTTKNFKIRRGPFYQFHEDYYRRYFENEPDQAIKRPNSLGSGFILDKQGYILTNNHVVENADEIQVRLSDSRNFQAQVIGTDPKTDLAIIKINTNEDLPTVHLGDSDALKVGDWVVAIGNPFGLTQTVTAGILSARGRVIGAGPYDNFLQTDASINPGNSGGPLFNLQGQVVGVNTAIIAGGQGIGFAIPINQAKVVIPQLIKNGTVQRGYLGIGLQEMTLELAKRLGLNNPQGALVGEVYQGSPAHQAGLQAGDVILKFKDKEVKGSQELPLLVSQSEVGSEAEIEYLRSGKSYKTKVRLSALGSTPISPTVSPGNESSSSINKMGLAVRNLNPLEKQSYGVGNRGVIITQVNPHSPAGAVGLQKGDVILELDKKNIINQTQFSQEVNQLQSGEVIRLFVKRGPMTSYFAFSL